MHKECSITYIIRVIGVVDRAVAVVLAGVVEGSEHAVINIFWRSMSRHVVDNNVDHQVLESRDLLANDLDTY